MNGGGLLGGFPVGVRRFDGLAFTVDDVDDHPPTVIVLNLDGDVIGAIL